jgi:hypothetical protein
MASISRWLNWTPDIENIQKSPSDELPKPPKMISGSYGSPTPGEIEIFSCSQPVPTHDPEGRAKAFRLWLDSACEQSGAVAASRVSELHQSWNSNGNPCDRDTFVGMLRAAGLEVVDGTDPLVVGLTLREDADVPAEWRKPFVKWADTRCLRTPRWFTNLKALHEDFCDWEIANNGVPCTREVFVQMLRECAWIPAERDGVILVPGIVLRTDVEAFKAAQRGKGRTA